mgnify:CR=1 FL=1
MASMGPRPEGHGEHFNVIFVILVFPFMLQWGHVQKDMESYSEPGLFVLQFTASMGPRPEGHGEQYKVNTG